MYTIWGNGQGLNNIGMECVYIATRLSRAVESKFQVGRVYSHHTTDYASLPYMGYSSLCDTQLQGMDYMKLFTIL